jgi:predicted PurR-regulated permease PerM
MEDLATAPWLRRLLVATLLAGLALLTFEVLKPFIVPLIWAVILAHVTWPVYRRLLALCQQRHTLAALVMSLAVSAAIVLPFVWLVAVIRSEVAVAYAAFAEQLARGVSLPRFLLELPVVGPWLEALLTRIAQDPGALNAEIRGWIERSVGELGAIVGGVGRNAAKLLIAMLSLFFMYRDGAKFAAQVVHVLEQFLGARVHGYVVAISDTVRAVVYGLVAAAVAQGTLAALGYWAAGLNAPITLGAMTTLAAFIPFLTPAVWIGASVWLLITGKTVAGIGLFLWGALAVSWIDNIVRPLVISNATRIPFLLVMFGVLGGVLAFGLVGLFIGPAILAVVMAVWREWLSEKRATV